MCTNPLVTFSPAKRLKRVIEEEDEDEPLDADPSVEAKGQLPQKETDTTENVKDDQKSSDAHVKMDVTVDTKEVEEKSLLHRSDESIKDETAPIKEDPLKSDTNVSDQADSNENDTADPVEDIIFDEDEVIDVHVDKNESPFKKMFDIWKKGEHVPYLSLARAFDEAQNTKSKLLHVEIMREYFRLILDKTPEDLVPTLYLCTNRLAPQYEGVELGLGESVIQKSIVKATGRDLRTIQSEYKKQGDLGLVALSSGKGMKPLMTPKPLTVRRVFQILLSIANEKGQGTQNKKIDHIRQLLVSCRERECLYIVKALQSKMRIGLGPKSIIAAVSQALAYHEYKNKINDEKLLQAHKIISTCFRQYPDWKLIVETALKHGLVNTPDHCKLTIGIPVVPMLAKPTSGAAEILKRLHDHDVFTAEYKYDGERSQVHYLPDKTIKIYTRNLENYTSKYPDIIQNFHKCLVDVDSVILDCETVAFDVETNKILPFQVLSTRSRKEVKLEDIKVKVCLFVFDILYINGESLLKRQLGERREILRKHVKEIPGEVQYVTSQEFRDTEELETFLQESVDNKCEGLMIKTLNKNAEYEPAERSFQWLKLKKDYMEGMTDSVDLVPIAAWLGKGKRTGSYASILLACYNEDSEEYQSVCKTGTGFSDAQLLEHTTILEKLVIAGPKNYYSVGEGLKPDVWFETKIVWEVKGADLSISPVHKAAVGLVSENKGIGLRFPRFVRARDDKSPETATTASQIAEMYYSQKITHGHEKEDMYD